MKSIFTILILMLSFGAFAQNKELLISGYKDTCEFRSDEENKVFTKTEEPARYPGGEDAFTNFMIKNINSKKLIDNGAGPGLYMIRLQITVGKDGSFCEVQRLTNYEFGIDEEIIRVLKLMPKWFPARQNKRVVIAYAKVNVPLQL